MTDSARTLFDSYQLGPIELRNRVVMAPLTRSRAAKGRVPRALNATYYAQRSSIGLIVSEATSVCEHGFGYTDTPGIITGEQVEGWRLVTDAVHAKGGKIFCQLWHVGRISHPYFQPNGELPVSSSDVKPNGQVFTGDGMLDYIAPRALELSEIPGVIEQYVRGARLAKEAGFDGVEIHGANGYLIEQFLYDKVNLRTDEYGGSIENRCRFALEVTRAVIDVFGSARTGIRFSPNGKSGGGDDSDRAALFTYLISEMEKLNPVYIHVLEGREGTDRWAGVESTPLLPLFRKLYSGTIIVNGGYDFASATEVVQSGAADLVAFGVLSIANPDLVERFRSGAPLNEPNRNTFYTQGEEGYTDYPFLEAACSATK